MKNSNLENFINSLRAVTIPMLLLILAIAIKVTALFYQFFEIPNDYLRLAAALFLAISVSLTLLTVSVNSDLLNSKYWFGFPEVFAICSVMIMLMIFKVFEKDNADWSWYFQRGFLSVFVGSTEYVYSKLFVKKYQLYNDNIDKSKALNDTQKELLSTKEELSKTTTELKLTKEELKGTKRHFQCRHCSEILTSHSVWKRHEAGCNNNPNNK